MAELYTSAVFAKTKVDLAEIRSKFPTKLTNYLSKHPGKNCIWQK